MGRAGTFRRILAAAVLLVAAGIAAGEESGDDFLDRMIEYSENLEQRILAEGRPLSESERGLAARAGIKNVDRVRILVLDAVPEPQDPVLRGYLDDIGFLELIRSARGTVKGYGIVLVPSRASRPTDLAHELIHVGQYERLGGIAKAWAYHLPNLAENGYRRSELEDEAFRLAPTIVEPESD